MKSFIHYFLVIFLLFPILSHAEDINAGFVQGLWYSSEPVFADTPTRIYVALRNNTPHDLTGMVYFTDNGKRVGSSEINALSGRLVEAWTDWTPNAGEHKLTASLSNTKLHPIGEGTEQATVADTIAEDTIFVDYDTDKDGVGNEVDTDDDNDNVSDAEEKARGSNPLVPNPQSQEKAEEEKKEPDTKSDDTPNTIPDAVSDSGSENERGLERYIGEGMTDTLLTNVTEKVENSKKSLDTYREKRNEEITAEKTEAEATQSGSNTDNATITRTKIDGSNKFLSSFVSGVATLLQTIWTFILWVFSTALAHPMFVQLFLLLSILYIFYRTARKLGGRPND